MEVALAITNAPPNGTLTSVGALSLGGTAPWDAAHVVLSGPGGSVDVTFPSLDNWFATLPLLLGSNTVSLIGYDVHGQALGTQSFSIVSTALTFLDADGDGLPDAWEKTHHLETLPTSTAATTDSDGDGLSNADEYLAGTDPRSPADKLTLSILRSSPGEVRLAYSALAGRSYRVSWKDNPSSGPWQTRDLRIPQNINQQVEIVDPAASERRIYRLETP